MEIIVAWFTLQNHAEPVRSREEFANTEACERFLHDVRVAANGPLEGMTLNYLTGMGTVLSVRCGPAQTASSKS